MNFAALAANLERMEGTKSRNELVRILAEVYQASTSDELGPITYLIQGRLAPFFEPVEIGLGERLLINAVAAAYAAPKEEVVKLNKQTGDLGLIARTLWESGEAGLEALKVRAGHPLRPQLAERLPNPEAVIKKLGTVGVQPKYDGLRVQIHKDGEEVSIFSRNLESMTEMFPELVSAASKLNAANVILDGEAIAYNPESEEYVPFQETTARRRKEGIQEIAESVPRRAFIVDVMFRDATDLTPLPYERRSATAPELIRDSEPLQ